MESIAVGGGFAVRGTNCIGAAAGNWWLRSPRNNTTNVANVNSATGNANNNNATNTNGVRPDLPRLCPRG